MSDLKRKIILGIVVTNIDHELSQCIKISGILPCLDPLADQITKNTAEILMAGIRKEAAGVGQHAEMIAERRKGGIGAQLVAHTVNMVIEPPCRPLNHSGNTGSVATQ